MPALTADEAIAAAKCVCASKISNETVQWSATLGKDGFWQVSGTAYVPGSATPGFRTHVHGWVVGVPRDGTEPGDCHFLVID